MAAAKRIFLFMAVNILVVATLSFVLYLFNIQPYLTRYGINYGSLAIFCLIWGMGGAFISLLLSKMMAKWMMGVKIIDPSTTNPLLASLVRTVHALSTKAGLPRMPEVGIYSSNEVNAFATGFSRSSALVAVSSGLVQRMGKDEIEGVLGHEVTHIANGDMVTMTLLQGVINAFVMFFARIIAFAVNQALSRSRNENSSSGFSPFIYQMTVFFFEMVFMVLGSLVIARFSRFREFRADAGGARLAGVQKMIGSLISLKQIQENPSSAEQQPKAFQAFKIAGGATIWKLFATHPPLDERIARLKSRYGSIAAK